MEDKKVLVINKGEEFKAIIIDKIDKTDIFYDQYVDAARMLDDIVAKRVKEPEMWCRTEYENNIIAFCGDRGEGKSSAMISFVKAAHEYSKNEGDSMFSDFENIKNTYFAEPIVIDPSMLDGIHNVLDIILATLYKKFRDWYENDNQTLYANKREGLLDQFQKVYKCISLINNQAKILDDEYDYEGHISKLSKLGQSTELRSELEELIRMYLETMMKAQGAEKKGKTGSLLIAIDDLDLCSFHVYKMAEQLRKYLIIPEVVIVMAVRVEQLELCVREENLRNFKSMVRTGGQESKILEEIINMSERYVAKLIPKVRRNYLPNVRMLNHVKILYKDRDKEKNLCIDLGESSVNDAILHLIYQKTGMKFLPEKSGDNYFLPDNLRDTVNLIVFFADMENPEGENINSIYSINIEKFSNYYERQWLPSNMISKKSMGIQQLLHTQLRLHEGIVFQLRDCYSSTKKNSEVPPSQVFAESNDSFFLAISWMEVYRTNVFGKEEQKYAYAFHILYTIRLNELLRQKQYDRITKFIGGFIWAGNFQNILPYVNRTTVDRSRFELSTFHAFNTIAGAFCPNRDILLPEPVKQQYYITEISRDDENRNYKIMAWTLLGMLSNTFWMNPSYQVVYTFNTGQIIFMNHSIMQTLHVSLENYIVSLCCLESIYEKVNMNCLGIDKEEFRNVIEGIQERNKGMIEAFRMIITNVDIAMEFREYCSKKRDIKESGDKDDIERTKEAINKFFRNAESFIKKYFGIENVKFGCLELEVDGVEKEINISHLYALLVQAGVEESGVLSMYIGQQDRDKEKMVKEFASKLREKSASEIPLANVVTYMVSKTARNAKNHLDNLASNIQRYYSVHAEENLEESEIYDLCNFYGKIIDLYIANPLSDIPRELSEKYKQVVKRYQKVCQ